MQPGKKPASRSSAHQKTPEQNTQSEVQTWPRLDLAPPELMLSGLRDWGRVILTSGYLDKADYAVVEEAVKRLRAAEPELLRLLGQMNALAFAPSLLGLIARVAGAVYVIGAHGAMPDTARVFFERSRAKQMRIRRAASTKEQELRAAIQASATANAISIPSSQPYKDAERIWTDVNQRLQGRGPVLVDVIARRLRPRSSRTRKK